MTKENILFIGTVRHAKAEEAALAAKYNIHVRENNKLEREKKISSLVGISPYWIWIWTWIRIQIRMKSFFSGGGV